MGRGEERRDALGVEVDDVDGAAAVVLDDLVLGVVCATADDPSLRAGLCNIDMSTKDVKSLNKVLTVVLDRDGVLADVLKPNELKGAV